MLHESEHIEYKSQLTNDIYKEIIAFANTTGGVIYIGIDDEGNVTGIEDIDKTYMRLTNGVRDAIAPDITMFTCYELQDENIIKIEVLEGSYKPYYIKEKGLRPAGVYVRQGATSAQASADQIRKMIKDSDGDIFEEMRCLSQDLTFTEAQNIFKRYGVEFSEEKYFVLGLKNINDNQYTNLGKILSDQCLHTTKIAVFGDEYNTIFKDAKEFGGSVLRQLDESYSYLSLCNRTSSTFNGLQRVDKSDYPPEALREALLNALVHRDYSYSGSIIININNYCIEFISLGGLLPGLSAEDIKSGISQLRNSKLADIFYRLRLIESYGTGIRRIFALYDKCPVRPRIELTPNTFKLVLPNMNSLPCPDNKTSSVNEDSPVLLTKQMKKVLQYLEENGEITEEELQELFDIKKTRAYLLARQMCDTGLIEAVGRGPNKIYKLPS